MLDDLIREEVSSQVPNHLMDVDHSSTGRVVFEAQWLDARIDHAPLAPPIVAHGVVPAHPSALHAVRPVHVGLQHRQNRIDVAGVKCLVGGRE